MRKRSTYRPRGVIRDTMAWVKSGFAPLTSQKDADLALRLRNHAALYSIEHGGATAYDLDALIAASNMTTALARTHGADWRDEIRSAADAVEAMQTRYYRWGKVQATPIELEACALLMRIHDAQLDASRISDLEQAIRATKRGTQSLEAA